MSEYPQLQQLRARVTRSPSHVVLVVGAGVTIGALMDQPCVAHATWRGLLGHGFSHAAALNLIDDVEHRTLVDRVSSSDVGEMVRGAGRLVDALGGAGGGAYRAWLEEVFTEFDRSAKPTAVIEQIFELQQHGVRIATTNYDGVLERFLGIESVAWSDGPAAEAVLGGRREGVLHLHGHWKAPQSVVLGNDDYERLLADPHNEILMRAVRTLRTMVFVGMGAGLTDPNLGRLRAWASEALRESSNTHYWLVRRGEEEAVSPTDLRDERTTAVVYDEHDELPEALRQIRPPNSGCPAEKAEHRHILLLLNVRVRGTRPHLDASDVRRRGDVTIADEDVVGLTMEGDEETIADPRWWEEVGANVRSAVERAHDRAREVGGNVAFVVAGHAPLSVFAYAGHISSRRLVAPIRFVNESSDKRSWDIVDSGANGPRLAEYDLTPAPENSLQRFVPRYAVFASAGKTSVEEGDLCIPAYFELFKGKGEQALANGIAGLSQIVPRPSLEAEGRVSDGQTISVGWRDIDCMVSKVGRELTRLGRELERSRGIVGYLGPTWGAFELGRALRPEVHGDVEIPHFSRSRNKYLPALTLSELREPVWFRRPRFLLLGAEPVMDTKVRVGATFTASRQALSTGGFSGENVVQSDGNVRLDAMHDRLARFKPHVVLVLAHGGKDGTLGLVGPTDDPQRAGADELVEAFRRSTVHPVLIILMVCDSSFLGERLIGVADHIVVSENSLKLPNAEEFSARFLALLAEGNSIWDAFETAKRVKVASCPPPELRLLSNPTAASPKRVFFHRA